MTQKSLEELTIKELLNLIGSASKVEQRAADTPAPAPAAPVELTGQRLLPVTEWHKHHSWPPLGGLRWLIFNERSNGFHQVVRRVGRRVLIDEAAFFTWVGQGGGVPINPVSPSGLGRPKRVR